MKNIIQNIIIILAIVVSCIFAYFGGQYLVQLYFGHKINNARTLIKKQIALQDDISSQVIDTFLHNELALSEYEDSPSSKNRDKLLKTTEQLNHLLSRASATFGLSVKRWVDRFNVWQYQFQKTLLSPKGKSKDFQSVGTSQILFFERKINTVISNAQNKYQLNTYDDLLYGPMHSTESRALTNKIETIYQNKAKALIPQAIEEFKQLTQYNSVTGCMDVNDSKLTPKTVAENVVHLQYLTQYCPFMAGSTTDDLCYRFTHSSVSDKNVLVFCKIAKEREAADVKHANVKYAHLSFLQYFSQYVQPLVPKYRKKLSSIVKHDIGNAMYAACEPSMQPVVAYRDPEIDAQTAVYVLYGNKICKDFFAHSDSDYAKQQNLINLISKKKQGKNAKKK